MKEISEIQTPRKTKTSYGKWAVSYQEVLSDGRGGWRVCENTSYFWRKVDALSWYIKH